MEQEYPLADDSEEGFLKTQNKERKLVDINDLREEDSTIGDL